LGEYLLHRRITVGYKILGFLKISIRSKVVKSVREYKLNLEQNSDDNDFQNLNGIESGIRNIVSRESLVFWRDKKLQRLEELIDEQCGTSLSLKKQELAPR
jgi:hypothetical protein